MKNIEPPKLLNHCWVEDCIYKARPNYHVCYPHSKSEDEAAKASVTYMPNVGTVKIRRSVANGDRLEVEVTDPIRGNYHKKGDIVIRRLKETVLAPPAQGNVARRWK